MSNPDEVKEHIYFSFFSDEDLESMFGPIHKENVASIPVPDKPRFQAISDKELDDLLTSVQSKNTKYSTSWATKVIIGNNNFSFNKHLAEDVQ